ncbi:hypothetical protein [Ancylobacter sp. TS-1]|uniref:hypothetical protein n=1 Tax=Ancylobacter sp. TS-1 TaxID=1850374 RepID=UPI001265C00D|nr:hypothetical protein [Ancylobacter sp. TS-1]QFR34735.1 hypothetical protein GBB76_17395 [Ancylobacter sp. TS-1]
MAAGVAEQESGNYAYEEREAVAVFADEASLNAAVDELIEAGLTQEDMSLLAHAARLSGKTVEELAESGDAPRAAFVSSDTRHEGLAAVVGAPALLAGIGAAAVIGTGGAALIPTLALTVGSTAAGGAVGLLLARTFGRKHANVVRDQLLNGGLLLWVHAPDPASDAKIVGILKKNGADDVHIHVVTRSWGIADVPLHDLNPDPLLG